MTSREKTRLTKAALRLAGKLCEYHDLAKLMGRCRGCRLLDDYVADHNYTKMAAYVAKGLSNKAQARLKKEGF